VSNFADLRSAVERFVAAAALPALLDPGEEPLRLLPDQWSVREWSGRLVVEAWDGHRSIARKVSGLVEQRRDRIVLATERFPKTPGQIRIADLAAPSGVEVERKATRTAFRERFGLMLERGFPAWNLEELSSEPNLEESLAGTFPRAFLRSGSTGMAAMAVPPGALEASGLVPLGLVWLQHLRRREKKLRFDRLLLYAPLRREREAAFRAALVDPGHVRCELHVYDDRDRASEVDLADFGNAESTLPPCRRPQVPNAESPEFPLAGGVERVEQADGAVSLRVRGLEFARWNAGKLTCGVGRRRAGSMETVAATARELLRARSESNPDRANPLYSQHSEGWLESMVRENPKIVDPMLLPAPLYGQVRVFGAPDRGVVDLLAVECTGRLVVVELKTVADLQLPFQALDYWVRVRKHLRAGDFERLGYFPGVTLLREDPRIVLVAPALEFHSTSEALIGAIRTDIDITRVGLAADWRRELRPMFRLLGAERP
jgi:hypothetical protein